MIAIDDYRQSPWNDLSTARKGAEAFTKLLAAQGYEVYSLYDGSATKNGILEQGFSWLAASAKWNDRALIYFAGHGHTLKIAGSEAGYIVPVDGGDDEAGLISLKEIETRAQAIRAHHQLYIMDSCYSGLPWTGGVKIDPRDRAYFRRIAEGTARQVISAGKKDQEVVDTGPLGYSLFTGAVLEGLEGRADLNRDGFVTVSELGAYLDTCGSNRFQSPTIGSFSGQGEGEFFFEIRKTAVRQASAGDCGFVRKPGGPQQHTACDLNRNGLLDSIDVNEMIGQALGAIPCTANVTGDGICNVVGVQRITNAVLTGECHTGR